MGTAVVCCCADLGDEEGPSVACTYCEAGDHDTCRRRLLDEVLSEADR